jgi:formylglycine-generating enzyme required for sulfatase activity
LLLTRKLEAGNVISGLFSWCAPEEYRNSMAEWKSISFGMALVLISAWLPEGALAGQAAPVPRIPVVAVKGGCYAMGDGFSEGDQDERPQHEVCVNDFALGQYAVTRGEFKQFVAATGYRTDAELGKGCYVYDGNDGEDWNFRVGTSWQNPGFPQTDRHPVVCVSWNDAAAFAFWLSEQTGTRYRLPTEAEWEFAARDRGSKERFPGTNDPQQIQFYANFCDDSCDSPFKQSALNDAYRNTAPVGSFRPNRLGLYDMAGNVWQWVGDWYDGHYYEKAVKRQPLTDWFSGDKRRRAYRENPTGPESGRYKVLRGGSWNSPPFDLRSTQRLRNPLGISRAYAGFRLAITN